MKAKLTDREQWRRVSSEEAPAVATDALDDLIISRLLDSEAELAAEAEEAGLVFHDELDVVQALLRLIFSPNVTMPLSRLQ
jgi:hypothetical protein